MNEIVKKLSEIERTAEAVTAHAEEEKARLEREIQDKRDAFDRELEEKTKKRLVAIQSSLQEQRDRVLQKQGEKNQAVIEEMKADFEEKHTVYAKEIVRHIIETDG